MKVWILKANAVTDVAGELMDAGGVIGVYDSAEKVNAAFDKLEDTYMRKRYDYDIDEVEVQ